MSDYLLDGKPRTGSPYGCHNAPRGINGAHVRHNHNGPIIAASLWQGSELYETIKCGKSLNGESLIDKHCDGCMWR